MDEYCRIDPPRQTGTRKHPTTTMGIPVITREAFDELAERWSCSRFEAMRYISDVAIAGYVDPPSPVEPVVINSTLPAMPESIEGQAVKFIRAILPPLTREEAEERIVEIVRLAGCEARAGRVEGDGHE